MSCVNSEKAAGLPRARIFVFVLGTALALSGTELNAQEEARAAQRAATGAAQHTLADLEEAFWVCDHAATLYGVLDMGTAVACAAATRDFRLRKFSGDFHAMLSWWQRSKARQHQLLDMRYGAANHR
jgi:hypothetical protein